MKVRIPEVLKDWFAARGIRAETLAAFEQHEHDLNEKAESLPDMLVRLGIVPAPTE